MPTTIAIRFPLGRYHANPWNRSVNEGAVEWPVSPWRLLRALVATWYTRWPELPARVIDGLLDALGDPPSYRTPPTWHGHTRHYLPGLAHKKGEPGGTDLTLDPFLWIRRDDDLLVRWDAHLGSEQRAALAKLAELLPYLGRAESVCEARLLDTDQVPDGWWWRPGADGPQRTRLLTPTRPVSRAGLEISTVEVRKQRRTLPPGTVWVDYATTGPKETASPTARPVRPVQAVRFAVTGRVSLKSTHGVLLADRMHQEAGKKLASNGLPDQERRAILGSAGAATHHHHAHWVPIAEGHERGAAVKALVLWVPRGLPTEAVAAVISLDTMSGHLGGRRDGEGYDVHGFPEVRLLFQAAGTIEQVAPELCGPARHWQSLTPYLPVRHRKREPLDEYLTADVVTELRYRDELYHRELPLASATPTDPNGRMPDRWTREFRRYRLTERLNKSRPGLGLRLEFPENVGGPLLLGKLSHFGYGVFVPEPG